MDCNSKSDAITFSLKKNSSGPFKVYVYAYFAGVKFPALN